MTRAVGARDRPAEWRTAHAGASADRIPAEAITADLRIPRRDGGSPPGTGRPAGVSRLRHPPGTGMSDSGRHDDIGRRLLEQVRMALDAEPLEAGMDHRAEEILADALEGSVPSAILDAIRACCVSDEERFGVADLLRCLARLASPGTEEWRTDLIRDALTSDNLEVRDAALEAADVWRDRGLLRVLQSHREPTAFLREEIAAMIRDWNDGSAAPGSPDLPDEEA